MTGILSLVEDIVEKLPTFTKLEIHEGCEGELSKTS
jgi:hypothetical protein